MKRSPALFVGSLFVLVVGGFFYVDSRRAMRPPAPPGDVGMVYPWGAMHVDENQDEADSALETSLIASFGSEPGGSFDPDNDGVREYSLLVLSGGGSAGAFGMPPGLDRDELYAEPTAAAEESRR